VTVLVATEDEISESVAIRLIGQTAANMSDLQLVRKNGNGYLRSRIGTFMSVAKRRPVLMLTDLDQTKCAPTLIRKWTKGKALPTRFLFRVAVREVESWLLADREGIAKYLSIAPQKITSAPEEIADPKAYLLDLARGAPRELRNELLPAKGSIASQGFGYNSRLREFVAKDWSPKRAAERCESLRRALDRVSGLCNAPGGT